MIANNRPDPRLRIDAAESSLTTPPRAFFRRDTESVARGLLGMHIARRWRGRWYGARIVETEAYLGANDLASHARRGLRSARNESMYLAGGHAYVYFTYGMHWCMNVVCGQSGTASAVLLRAGSIVDGVDLARSRRLAARADFELARGPARLCAALGIDGSAYGTDLLDGAAAVTLRPPAAPVDAAAVRSGPRVGVTDAHDLPWRFWLDGERSVSVYRRHSPRSR